jgi:HlyD family secretion protein
LNNDPNVAKLYTGLAAHVDIKTQRHEGVLKVPSQAVLAREVEELPLDVREKNSEVDKNKTFATVVYKYADGKAKATPVKIGASDLTHTVISSGLNEGDKVIVGPYKVLEKLKNEQKVRDEREVEAQKKAKDKKGKSNGNEPAGK